MNHGSRSGRGASSVNRLRQRFSSYLRSAQDLESQAHWVCDGEKIFQGKVHAFEGALGAGKTDRILRFLSENPGLRVAWLEERVSIFPISFEERGVSLSRVFFCETGSDGVWTLLEILRSGLFPVIVCDAKALVSKGSLWSQEKQWRRIQVIAHKTQSVVLIWRESYEESKKSSVVHLHSEVSVC